MPDVTALPRPGDVFAGKYLIERVVGSGKNSLVFVAQHCVTGKHFAIEWVLRSGERARHDALIDEDDSEDTFAAESGNRVSDSEVRDAGNLVSDADDIDSGEHRVVGHFRHPNVLEVYDVGEASGSLYTVMEWSEGESLEARIARSGPMSIVEASRLLVPCMRGMHEAHVSGILHHDLKPSNIFLSQSARSGPEVAKVLDFEIASELGGDGDASALVLWRGARESKPYYQAPEQLGGLSVDHRADVYAFGAILYEVLTGRPPFAPVRHAQPKGRSTYGVPALRSRSERLPPGADVIVGRAMARDVSRRFQTLHELADAFEALARSPVAFSPSTIPGPPPFDGELVRRPASSSSQPTVVFEGLDAGTDPGVFGHEVSFTRSRPWPRPTASEEVDEPVVPDSRWSAAQDWNDPMRTAEVPDTSASSGGFSAPELSASRVPEWSEPPTPRESRRTAQSQAPTHTPFYLETSFQQRAPIYQPQLRRDKLIYVAGVVAVFAVAGLVIVARDAPSTASEVVTSFEPATNADVAVIELESQRVDRVPHAPAVQPNQAAPSMPEPEPGVDIVGAPILEVEPARPRTHESAAIRTTSDEISEQFYRLPLRAAEPDRSATVVRKPGRATVTRSTPQATVPSALPKTPKTPAGRPLAPDRVERSPAASSGDPLPMQLM